MYTLFAALCFILGGGYSLISKPGRVATSISQHFAAGVVFAAVALELLPKLSESKMPITLTVGFAIGVILMLLIKTYSERRIHGEKGSIQVSTGLITAVAVDLFIDGLLVGIAFSAGERGGILVALALAIEVFSLGLATLSTLKKEGFKFLKRSLILFFLALMIVLGTALSLVLVHYANTLFLHGLLAFGVASLLYLVTEELLERAHQVKDTPFIASSFFFGFLAIFIIDTQLHLF